MTQNAANPPIRVLVVDDSAFMRAALSRMLAAEHGMEVVATVSSGAQALEKIAAIDPDVVTLDVEMPGLDGLQTLRQIMTRFPRPVIMVSAVTEAGAGQTFDALAAGAFDYVPKQMSASSLDILHIRPDLVAKIHAAARSHKPHSSNVPAKKPPQSQSATVGAASAKVPAIVAIGASTGGPTALEQILPRFPKDFPLPILLVQHMPAGFTAAFAKRLNNLCALSVREATHREVIEPGVVYLAPAGRHMRVEPMSESRTIVTLDPQPQDSLHIPSVNVMMSSVAAVFKKTALAVILTGMGSDGAEGVQAIYRQGGLTIGQDEATCTVYGMPRACAELGVLTRVLPLLNIPAEILQATRSRKRA